MKVITQYNTKILLFCLFLLGFSRALKTESCDAKLDLLLLLDSSGSAEEVSSEQRRWAHAIVHDLPTTIDGRVALIQYASNPLTEFNFSRYDQKQMLSHIEKMDFKAGVTRTGVALAASENLILNTTQGARSGSRKIVAIFTDGLSIDDTALESISLRTKIHKVYVISVGSEGFVPEMLRIAGEVENIFGPSDLKRFEQTLFNQVKTDEKCRNTAAPKTTSPTTTTTTEDHEANVQITPHKETPTSTTKSTTKHVAVPIVPKTLATTHKRVEPSESELTTTNKPSPRKAFAIDFTHKPTTLSSTDNIPEKPKKVKKIRRVVRRRKGLKGKGVKRIRKLIRRRTSSNPTAAFATTASQKWATLISTTEGVWTTSATKTTKTHSRSSTTFTSPSTTTTVARKSTRARAAGVKHEVVGVIEKQCPLDILFLVDSSGSVASIYEEQKASNSVQENNAPILQNFVSTLLEAIDPEQHSHRVALIQFAGARLQKMEWSFDKFRHNKQLMKAFRDIRHITGTTYIGAALRLAVQLLEARRTGVPTILVVVSDGYTQDDPSQTAAQIQSMSNVETFVISLSPSNNMPVLQQISPNHVFINDEVDTIRQRLIDRFTCRTKTI